MAEEDNLSILSWDRPTTIRTVEDNMMWSDKVCTAYQPLSSAFWLEARSDPTVFLMCSFFNLLPLIGLSRISLLLWKDPNLPQSFRACLTIVCRMTCMYIGTRLRNHLLKACRGRMSAMCIRFRLNFATNSLHRNVQLVFHFSDLLKMSWKS